MERRRDYLRPTRHDPRLTVAGIAPGGRATIDADSTAKRLSRRRLIMLGAGAAAGALAGLSPQRAAAVLKLDVTQGNVQPVPIAIPDFVGVGLQDPAGGRNVSLIIASNLRRSGLFAPIDPAAYIEKISTIDTLPRFPDWRQINAQALVTGRITQSDARLKAEFRLWDVFAGQQLRGEQYNTTADNWRRIAHIISDAIYERITGDKGYFDTRIVFVDEHDAGIEITFISGDPLVDGVGNDVGYSPPIVSRGVVLLAAQLLSREYVPQPELGLKTCVGLRDAAGDQRLGIDLPPVGKARQGVDGDNFLDISGLIDRSEQAGAAQVRGDDLTHVAAGRRIQSDPDEIRDRNRHRLDVAFGDVELEHRRRRLRRKACERARRSAQHDQSAASEQACRRIGISRRAAARRSGGNS